MGFAGLWTPHLQHPTSLDHDSGTNLLATKATFEPQALCLELIHFVGWLYGMSCGAYRGAAETLDRDGRDVGEHCASLLECECAYNR